MNDSSTQRISLVIPVFGGEKTLPTLISEIEPLTQEVTTAKNNNYVVCEVILVHDCGPDRSDRVIQELADKYSFVQPVWLSRNYGQHAASMAGMASATGDWVVTLDEDGQQDPADIGHLLDTALSESLQLVYVQPTNLPSHGWLRNTLSRTAKAITIKLLSNSPMGKFNSYRLIDGEIARTLAAYCGNGVYLDVGLYWMVSRIGHCPLKLRNEMDRPSGYSYSKLFGHFWNLILTTGTLLIDSIHTHNCLCPLWKVLSRRSGTRLGFTAYRSRLFLWRHLNFSRCNSRIPCCYHGYRNGQTVICSQFKADTTGK